MYNPYFNQFPIQNPYQRAPGYSGQIIQVNGKAGADALQMAPNSSMYVQDSTQGNRIFLCITDGAGYKTVRGIIGTFEEEQEKVEKENALANLEVRIKALEDKIDGYASNDAVTRKSSNGKGSATDK